MEKEKINTLLPQSFYERDSLIVAQELIGKFIKHKDVVVQITETEAYRWPDDSANHCYKGRTKRNTPMWEQGGIAYIYICYGMHVMLNIVTGHRGEGAAVLIRSGKPISGLAEIMQRRKMANNPNLLTGPGKVGQALGINKDFNCHPLYKKHDFVILNAPKVNKIISGPRIGINYARLVDRHACWRFAEYGSIWVSHKTLLT